MKSGYIAVIAGTTESRTVIEALMEEKKEIAAFTATELGTKMLQNYNIEIIEGRKNQEQFLRFFKAFKPSKVYDASHPFAAEVTQNVQKVCERLSIPYERVKREEKEYDYEKIVYVSDTKEAIELLKEIKGNILLTTGVKTAGEYYEHLDRERLFIRVLKSGASVQICTDLGYEPTHVFGEDPPFSAEANEKLIRQTKASILVTKDSGVPGGVPEKMEAAKKCGIPVIMIRRPEDEKIFPRILVTAAGSGSGKTTVTLGLMQALKSRGKKVQGYKCGPDYIDPMHHKRVTGRASINIDPVFHKDHMESMVMKYADQADIGIFEGVMGFYDGKGSTISGSTFEVAEETKTPAILVISVKGIANTIIPMIQGILNYQENTIKGVILNQCSQGFYVQIKPKIEAECGVTVVGYLPYNQDIQLQSRHLGLYMADEIKGWNRYLSALEGQVKATIDLMKVCEIAEKAGAIENKIPKKKKQYPVSIAVAQDEAFCFYYEDNLRILEEYGAELIPFSPLHDSCLPKRIQGIYIGGGYPELFAEQLEENETMRMQIAKWCQKGKPVIAECGGYMYLGRSMIDQDGQEYEMCCAFSHRTKMQQKLNMHFGYVNIFSEQPENPFSDVKVRAHEFHYSEESGDHFSCIVEKNENRRWMSGYLTQSQYAAYPHVSFRGNETFIEYFLTKMQEELE
ncbi:MAG: cobyrinate a,c-diamide synthase [Lachnospiraceae bacterium]|nr:cobyrinate a,c-diamide synthase [Lachnospiraceae bacterium]